VSALAKWNPLALKILMWVIGLLLVVSSAASFIGVSVFPTNTGIAGFATAPVAGIAFGAGIMIAGFDPVANVSWVRAVVVYAILEVVYNIFTQVAIGVFDLIGFIIGIIVAVLVLVLYPNKPALWMQSGAMGSRA
jgi:hypothetical protein